MTNAQKTPVVKSLSNFAQKKIAEQLQLAGKSLPVSIVSVAGSIVKVNFEIQSDKTLPQIDVPVCFPEYIRVPFQAGDFGVVVPSDVFLGGITGLGSGTASLVQPANLSPLVFVPVGNANWAAPTDPDKIELYGNDGFILRNKANDYSITGSSSGIQMKFGSNTVTVSNSGVDIEGVLTINGKPYLAHEHSGVMTGGGFSGPVFNP